MDDGSQNKRVLFVAYQFPPAGGIGVHRVVKFVKYLTEFGWDSSVLTVSNPSVPMLDDSLCADIPETTTTVKAKTWEPGYSWKQKLATGKSDSASCPEEKKQFLKPLLKSTANLLLQPDMQILWYNNAVRAGRKLLQKFKHDAIIATAPPFSSFLVGRKLAKKTGIPLVLDYRDEWGISNAYWENKQPNFLSAAIQSRMQKSLLKDAAMAIATTPSSCESVQRTADEAGSSVRCEFVYNGYDPDDFNQNTADNIQRKDYGNGINKFRLTYAGTLWNLNSIQPLIDAILHLEKESPALLEQMEFVVAGRRTAEQEALLDQLEQFPCQIIRLPFISHDEAVQLMQTSDCLALLNSNLPGAERVVNGKIFEYIAAEKPFLLISPPGDMWQLTANCPYALPCNPASPKDIAIALGNQLEQYRKGVAQEVGTWSPESHQRRGRAKQLAGLLNEVTCSASSSDYHNSQHKKNKQEKIPIA